MGIGAFVSTGSLVWLGYELTAGAGTGGPAWFPGLTLLAGIWFLFDARRDFADCVLATDPTPEEFDTYASVLERRAATEPPINDEQFWRALDDLEERYE